MGDYLTGYLDIIPESERKKVSDILKQNQELFIAGGWSEEEFEKTIDQLITNHRITTELQPQTGVLDSSKHNKFFSGMQMDLNLLFAESDLIESGLNSYDRLYAGILSDLQKETASLKQKVNSLRLTSESESGVIVKSFDFSTDTMMETKSEGNRHLFLDRDGTSAPIVMVERNQDASRIILSKTSENDHIRDNNGMVTASIEIIDRRGTPMQHARESLYGIDKALDSSSDTYWGEVILSDEPLKVKMII